MNKRIRLKIKIFLSTISAVISLVAMPFIFKLAEIERGYKAYGGEMLIPIVTVFSVFFMAEGITQLKKTNNYFV